VDIVNSDERRKRYAIIKLPFPVVNPLFYDLLVDLGGKNLKTALDDLMTKEKSVLYQQGDDFITILDEQLVPAGCPKWERTDAIYKIVSIYAENELEDGSSDWQMIYDNLHNLLIDRVIVLPPDLRPSSPTGGHRQLMDKINRYYVQILTKKESMRNTVINIHADKVLYYTYFVQIQRDVNELYTQILVKMAKKEGLIRGNILGKRIDFSGRAVIVPEPTLNIDECALPYFMVLEIFKLPIAKKILETGKIKLLNEAIDFVDECIERGYGYLYKICESIVENEICILNRQPSLHRLGMLAFKIKLTIDKVIKIHPLVCPPFNADFDGDQMAVYLPVTEEAREEARNKISVMNNFSSPSNEKLTTTPSQDIILGIYALTGNNFDLLNDEVEYKGKTITEARKIFNECLPEDFPVIDGVVDEKILIKILTEIKDNYPKEIIANVLDNVKRIGFKYATLFGSTMSLDDFYVEGASEIKDEIYKTGDSRSQLATLAGPTVSQFLKDHFKYAYMIESGARGTWDQAKQLILTRGFISNFDGEILERPIKHSLLDGLTPREFFASTYGSRKGLLDVALNTGTSGYLSRKLIFTCANLQMDVDLVDCGTTDTLTIDVETPKIADMLVRRWMVKDGQNVMITKEDCKDLVGQTIEVRSPIYCKSPKICQTCYGDLYKSINSRFIGIIAAQTLGERSTQLVLRTFHTSGAAVSRGSEMVQQDIIGDLSTVSTLLHKFDSNDPSEIVSRLFRAYDKDIHHVHFECVIAQLMWHNYKKWRLLPDRDTVEPNFYSIQSVPNQESWILAMAFSNPKRSIINGILNEGRYSGVLDKILKGERIA
jgi:DNA-directed RNA polymerase subunit beta'